LILTGKTALVTGGSRGIGKAIAIALAKAGANVALSYRESGAEAEDVVETITQHGGNCIAVKMEVRDRQQVKNAFSETENRFADRILLSL
jgi:NAD(P)-dependent dehydrogenase (short-subunit alcohol dehydrogenase family)